jgi:hypothetical protein
MGRSRGRSTLAIVLVTVNLSPIDPTLRQCGDEKPMSAGEVWRVGRRNTSVNSSDVTPLVGLDSGLRREERHHPLRWPCAETDYIVSPSNPIEVDSSITR